MLQLFTVKEALFLITKSKGRVIAFNIGSRLRKTIKR